MIYDCSTSKVLDISNLFLIVLLHMFLVLFFNCYRYKTFKIYFDILLSTSFGPNILLLLFFTWVDPSRDTPQENFRSTIFLE